VQLKSLVPPRLRPVAKRYRNAAAERVLKTLKAMGVTDNRLAQVDVSHILHDCRSALLREMPPGCKTLVSAGCAGRWYFDWIERTYGTVQRHVGLEYYTPKPSHLPANVVWIENTVSDMSGVADASCDMVFSGQNVEHLWPEEVAGFFAEASRVTKTGGWLVVDSPNRKLTAPFNWSHPEHTVELTVSEALELFDLAGFAVTKTVGIWLCRDPRTGRLLPFDPNVSDPEWSTTERMLSARNCPEDSFLWWIEGRRTSQPPQVEALQTRMAEIFSAAWPERSHRMQVTAGRTEQRGDVEWVVADRHIKGPLIQGPSIPLKAGSYEACFVVDVPTGANGPIGHCDVLTADNPVEPVGSVDVPEAVVGRGPVVLRIPFKLEKMTFGVELRSFSTGENTWAVRKESDVAEIERPAA
jgi:hypothetical protein